MSDKQIRAPWPPGCRFREENIRVPMQGIATIPQDAIEFWKIHGFDVEPPLHLRDRTDAQIAEAMAEHRRRREAVKLGMKLDEYFSPDRSSDAEDG